ncbi:MAG TPA: hypothetical protein VEL05_13145 [Candidatus Acidoferrum sp.]|nr:hypothetical protein [Candidatus Acidoferrum sp.]
MSRDDEDQSGKDAEAAVEDKAEPAGREKKKSVPPAQAAPRRGLRRSRPISVVPEVSDVHHTAEKRRRFFTRPMSGESGVQSASGVRRRWRWFRPSSRAEARPPSDLTDTEARAEAAKSAAAELRSRLKETEGARQEGGASVGGPRGASAAGTGSSRVVDPLSGSGPASASTSGPASTSTSGPASAAISDPGPASSGPPGPGAGPGPGQDSESLQRPRPRSGSTGPPVPRLIFGSRSESPTDPPAESVADPGPESISRPRSDSVAGPRPQSVVDARTESITGPHWESLAGPRPESIADGGSSSIPGSRSDPVAGQRSPPLSGPRPDSLPGPRSESIARPGSESGATAPPGSMAGHLPASVTSPGPEPVAGAADRVPPPIAAPAAVPDALSFFKPLPAPRPAPAPPSPARPATVPSPAVEVKREPVLRRWGRPFAEFLRPPAWRRHDLLVVAVAVALFLTGAVAQRRLATPSLLPMAQFGLHVSRPSGWLPPRRVGRPPSGLAVRADIRERGGNTVSSRAEAPSATAALPYHILIESALDPTAGLEIRIAERPTSGDLRTALVLERVSRYGEAHWAAEATERTIGGRDWFRTEYHYAYKGSKTDAPRIATAIEYATINGRLLYTVTVHGNARSARRLEVLFVPTLAVDANHPAAVGGR